MSLRLVMFLFFATGVILAQNDYALKADSFLQDLKLDSTNLYLTRITDESSAISYRKKFLAILATDGSDKEVIKAVEAHIDKYKEEPFSDIIRITYLSYFSELMIPEDSKNEYNLSMINRAIRLNEKDGVLDSFMLMHSLHNKGALLFELDRHLESISAYERALAIAENIDTRNDSFLGIICYNLAFPLHSMGQFHRSYELVERSAAELSKLEKPDVDYFHGVYLELVSTSLQFGYLEKAENYLTKAENIYRDNKNALTGGYQESIESEEMAHLYTRMQFYNYTFDIEGSLAVLAKAEKQFRNHDGLFFRLRLAAIYNYMGEAYVIDQPEKSFEFYEKAIRVFDQKDDNSYGLMFEFNLGKAYLNSKNYHKAREIAAIIIGKGKEIDDYRLPFFYFLEAKAYLENGLFAESLDALNELVNIMNIGEDEIDLVSQQGIQAFVPTQNLNEGYLMTDAAKTIEMHMPPSEETNRAMNSLYNLAIANFKHNFKNEKFSAKSRDKYEEMMDGLIRTDEYLSKQSLSFAEMIRFSENASSRNLWEKFKFKNERLELVSSELLVEEQGLRSAITSLKLNIRGADSLEVKAEIFEKELVLADLELEKRKKYSSFYKFEDFDYDFDAFQAGLSEEQMVLKYEFLDSVLYVYEITSEEVKIRNLDSIQHVNIVVLQFAEMLRDPSSDLEAIAKLSEELAKKLLPDEMPGEIIVVSDRVLHYLPFDLLSRNGKYLLEDYSISNATSLSLLDEAQGKRKINSSIIVAPSYDDYVLSDQQLAVRGSAYNLEGALAEAEAIADIIPSIKLSRSEASKKAFMADAGKYDLLHLSMHSFMNDEDPELSSLVFSDEEDDNELFISELYGMNLNAQLAVLSACNTGVGKEVTGEGMVSVNRAFTYAGVPSVVSSLWSAPDLATKDVMTEFYNNLKKGDDKSLALRQAKLAYLNGQSVDALKHPFFWGGFVLHGNTESLEFAGMRMGGKMLLLFGGILFLIMSMLVFRNRRRSKS